MLPQGVKGEGSTDDDFVVRLHPLSEATPPARRGTSERCDARPYLPFRTVFTVSPQ